MKCDYITVFNSWCLSALYPTTCETRSKTYFSVLAYLNVYF